MKPKKNQPSPDDSLRELADKLTDLADELQTVAVLMDYYGGFDGKMQAHAKELLGAAQIARQWSRQVRKGKNW